jgi:hypothetical protein
MEQKRLAIIEPRLISVARLRGAPARLKSAGREPSSILSQILVGDAGCTLFVFIYDGTRSPLVCPECAMTSLRDSCVYTPDKRDSRRCAL